MKFLTEENTTLDTDLIGNRVEKQLYFMTLDFSRPKSPDYLAKPLNGINEYNDAAAEITIGDFELILPLKWHILVCDAGVVEYVPLKRLSGKGMKAFCLNPISGYMPSFLEVRILDSHRTASWSCPIFDKDNLLVIPVGKERTVDGDLRDYPTCIMAGEPGCRVPDLVELANLW